MNRHSALAVILITFLIAACSAASAQEETKPAPKPEPKLTNWYKVEITLSEFEDGKKTNTRSYTMEAEENGSPAVMKLGDRVPIVTGGPARAEEEKLLNVQFQYLDVGLNITSWVRERQGRLGLTVSVDQSSVAKPNEALRVAPNQPMIRQLKMENTAFVTLGKTTLIASVDDPGKANHKYTVDATVTKLNP
jgi:hypothetical protein